MVATTLLVLQQTGQADALALIAQATQLCFALVLVTGAVLLLCRWYLLDQPASGWIASAMIVLAIYLRPELYLTSELRSTEVLVVPTDVLCMLTVAWMSRCSVKQQVPAGWRHPVLLGLLGGFALTFLRSAWLALDLDAYQQAITLLVSLAFPVAVFVCARWVLASSAFPDQYRWHLVVPLALGIGFYHFVPTSTDPLSFASLLVTTVCAGTAISTLTTSIALVQDAFATQSRRLAQLSDRAALAEVIVHDDAERLHECRAALAGISSASQLLIANPDALGADQSQRLQELLNSELARLQSLLDPRIAPGAEPSVQSIELDEVVEPLVLAALSRGVDVEYRPTRTEVQVQPEALVSAVLALVGNAERHAPGARLSVWTTIDSEHVALHISDDGPGIPASLEDTLFTRGERGDQSPGEGLGLYAARREIRRSGGDLRLEQSHLGARFAVILPRVA
ncbi:hypothetical protein GCM10009668_02110 [Nocardioides dubius]|uniref:histidine kinase n=1 Tax=Nocardioides dubius TaxID=317019 RepID=A0ABN1TJU2_9ACTN